jgi:hypothetical protein
MYGYVFKSEFQKLGYFRRILSIDLVMCKLLAAVKFYCTDQTLFGCPRQYLGSPLRLMLVSLIPSQRVSQ